MICIFSLFSEMTTDNPWQVESIQDFSFLKCPECIFDTKTEDTFRKHATDNHPLSLVLFQEPLKGDPIIVKNEILDLIKNEEGSYDPLTIEGYEDNISQEIIEEESKMHLDIVQGSMKEDYKNLAYKHLMGLQWAADECRHFR